MNSAASLQNLEPILAKSIHVNLARRAEIGRERSARTRSRIIAAAFKIFGNEEGPFARIEDIAKEAGVTRATFYNYFYGLSELREALSYEVTHEFLDSVIRTISQLRDARERSAVAVRLYLHRALDDRQWAWSMINLSASGLIFGAETYHQAERTIREGMEANVFAIPSSRVGRDILLGGCLAAMGSIVREDTDDDYPEIVASHILCGLGVPYDEAEVIARQDMPELTGPG